MYTRDDVREWALEPAFSKGQALFQGGHVRQLKPAPRGGEDVVVSGSIQIERRFAATFHFEGGCLWSECACPTRFDCAHGVAVALGYLASRAPAPAAPRPERPEGAWVEPLTQWQRLGEPPVPPPKAMVVRLRHTDAGPFPAVGALSFALARQAKTFRPLRLHSAMQDLRHYQAHPGLANLARVLERLSCSLSYRWADFNPDDGWIGVKPAQAEELLRAFSLMPYVQDEAGEPLRLHAGTPLVTALAYAAGEDGARLTPVLQAPAGPVPLESLRLVGDPATPWAWQAEGLYPLPAPLAELCRLAAPIVVPPEEQERFERRHLPALMLAGRVVGLKEATSEPVEVGTPSPQLLVAEAAQALTLTPGFRYGTDRVDAEDDLALLGPPGGPWVRRDPEAEASWLSTLRKALRLPADAPLTLEGDAALDFLASGVESLTTSGFQVLGLERLDLYRLLEGAMTTRLRVASGIDWFDLSAEVRLGDEPLPWPALAAALAEGRRYVRLGSGAFAKLPTAWLQAQRRLLARAGLAADALGQEGGLRLPRHQAGTIAQLAEAVDEAELDPGWLALHDKLASFGGIEEAPLPPGFLGELRDYQRRGFSYLSFLREYGLGGILADDMGLGKTIQAIALLAANHPPGAPADAPPSLVVAPNSVVANWQRELARFAPRLRVLVLHGAERDPHAVDGHDVVLTTYATARLDVEAHLARSYHTLILDEAQFIKNPTSQTARALCRFKARHRHCLTGTPIENDLGELWSLFHFLMPGFLGSERGFRERYVLPIAAGDADARVDLKRRVAPFILRRLKAQVATELPPRTDVTVWCELASAQKRAYDALLAAGRERVDAAVAERGFEASRITVLDALLKLRQICCHPALLKTAETQDLPSSKLEAALELIDEVVTGGHRALVFSQFTQVLAVLRERLDALGIAYEYLDGATRKRQEKVDRFNAGTTPLFLISLRAGGTGLNLTGADYVLHYDQWWNPAVEDQATDRAHRIGQTRQVFNYKLVAKDTIEEKLMALQEKKRGLVRDLLDADEGGKRLTREDLAYLFEAAPR